MRAVVLCSDPDRSRAERDSPATILADLGCDVALGRFDLGGLDLPGLTRTPPNVVVVDAADELLGATRAIKRLRGEGPLAEAPVLLALTLARLPALDFSVGFDDFILEPLVPAELYARVRQLDWRTAAFGSDEVIKLDELVIDVAGHEVRLGGRRLTLTHQEFELLRFLAQHRGRAFTRDQLLERVWGYRYQGGTRTVDIHVRRVRAKLGPVAGALIETVRNHGYKFNSHR